MIEYRCDKCGKLLNVGTPFKKMIADADEHYPESFPLMLCDKCSDKFRKWLKEND